MTNFTKEAQGTISMILRTYAYRNKELASAFAAYIALEDPTFDKGRFLFACGLSLEEIWNNTRLTQEASR